MLAYGNSKTYSQLSANDFYTHKDAHTGHHSGGFIGVFRWILIGGEALASLFLSPAVGALLSVATSGAFMGLDLKSYSEGHIRSKGALMASLGIDAMGFIPALSIGANMAQSGGIIIKTIDSAWEQAKVERLYIKGTEEFQGFNSVLGANSVSRLPLSQSGGVVKVVERVSKYQLKEYRQTFLKQSIKISKKAGKAMHKEIKDDKFEQLMQATFGAGSNKDLAIIRNMKSGRQFRGDDMLKYSDIIDKFSPSLRKSLIVNDKDPRVLLDNLHAVVNETKLTSKLNRFFASGERDWATKKFWKDVRSGKAFRSGNFYYAFSHLFKTTNVAREVITKPVNNVIRHLRHYLLKIHEEGRALSEDEHALEDLIKSVDNSEMGVAERADLIKKHFTKLTPERLKKFKGRVIHFNINGSEVAFSLKKARLGTIGKLYAKQQKIKKALQKDGHIFISQRYVMGYRKLDDRGHTVDLIVHFNLVNTNAFARGSKNIGGKKPVMLLNFPKAELHRWNSTFRSGSFYNRYIALSRGGRAIAYEITDEIFSNFLTFIPLQALRNVLSEITNIKYFIKDVTKGDYFSSYANKFKDVLKRLYIHKTGKLAGSLGYVFGEAWGKEGKRFGLGIARGFQHSKGQKLGSFRTEWFAKNVLPRSFKGTALRIRRHKYGRHYLTSSQSTMGTKRYGRQIRRTTSLFK